MMAGIYSDSIKKIKNVKKRGVMKNKSPKGKFTKRASKKR